jgi:hypothetical protein
MPGKRQAPPIIEATGVQGEPSLSDRPTLYALQQHQIIDHSNPYHASPAAILPINNTISLSKNDSRMTENRTMTLAMTWEREAKILGNQGLTNLGLSRDTQPPDIEVPKLWKDISQEDDFLNLTETHPDFYTVQLSVKTRNGEDARIKAIIDSAATANFIDSKFQETLQHTTLRQYCPVVKDAKGRVLAPASSTAACEININCSQMQTPKPTKFRGMELKTADIILGLPWLREHNPKIDWRTGELARCDDKCNTETLAQMVAALDMLNLAEEREDGETTEELSAEEELWTYFEILNLIENVPGKSPEEQVAETRLPTKYEKYRHVFDKAKAERLPPHRPGLDHEILLKPGFKPPWGPIYNLSEEELGILKDYLEKMLRLGMIRRSKSPAAASLLFAGKKDGSYRPCADYRGLNSGTIPNRYPIPLISEILNRLGQAVVFTKLDLRNAYHLIRIKEGHEWMTAFRTRFGLFEYLVLPFGLSNGPATFQAYIDQCLREFIDVFVIVYLDDILIYSREEHLHTNHVSKVLEQLDKHGLFCKLEKCEFDVKEVEFLGYIVSQEGIRMDETRVATIQRWPVPGTARETLAFLGFCNFYRRFIHQYSLVALGMTTLLKGKQQFKWTEGATIAFEDLKDKFKGAPILVHFSPKLKRWLECDASVFALAGIISQKQEDHHLHPIAFYSRKFIPAEINYSTFDQELLAIVESVKHWRHFLEGAQEKITIISDHNNLRYFMTTRVLTRRQARWAVTLSTIDFEIIHRAGSKNPADGPSRRPDYARGPATFQRPLLNSGEQEMDNLIELEGAPDLLHLIVQNACSQMRQGREEVLQELKEISEQKQSGSHENLCVTGELPGDAEEDDQMFDDIATDIQNAQKNCPDPEGDDFTREDGLWIHKGTQLWVPEDANLRKRLLKEFHDSPTAGHFGRDRTILAMKRLLFWKGMDADVDDFIGSCLACQRNKPSRTLTPGELEPLPIPGRPWGSITLDMITDLPPAKRSADFSYEKGGKQALYDAILVIVCRLTKEGNFIPIRKDMDSKQFAHIFLHHVFSKHGMPDDITTDRAKLFTSAFWETFTKGIGTKRKISTAFHPQTDGQTERMNAVLEGFLRMFVDFDQENWADLLDLAEFAWGSSPSPATKVSPFEANGKTIKPFQLARLQNYKSESARDLMKRLQGMHTQLKETLTHAQDLQAKYYDAKHKRVEFKVGDLVMLNTKNLNSNQPCKKLGPKKAGPFRVDKRIGNQAYQLHLPEKWECHNVFHVNLLTKYRGSSRDLRGTADAEGPGAEIVLNDQGEEVEEWEVEAIINSQYRTRWRKLYYLVRWKGWTADHDSWHKAEDLEHAREAIMLFHEKHPFKPRPDAEE